MITDEKWPGSYGRLDRSADWSGDEPARQSRDYDQPRLLQLLGVGGDPYPGIPGIGSFIDAARWDGSDFFIADNNNEILIVNATAKRLQELSLHNVVLEEAWLELVRSD